MNQKFFRYIRIAAFVTLFCVCGVTDFALAAGNDWQSLVNKHAILNKQGDHKRALEVAHKALELLTSSTLKPEHVFY